MAYEAYTLFEQCKRHESTSVTDHIVEFEWKYNQIRRHKMVLPEPVLAFKLLDSAGFSQKERQLVLTATSTLDFSSMKSALKRIFGGSTVSNTGNINIKEEPVYLTSYGKRGKQRYFGQSRGRSNSCDKSYRQGGARPRGTNPLKRDGTMSKCAICESIFHWVKDCTDGDKSDRVNVHSMKKRKVMKGLEPVNHQTWKQMKVVLLLQLKS